MKKVAKRIALRSETIRQLSGSQLARIMGGEINLSYADGCLSTSYHGGVCNSGQVSCDPATCTISASG